MNSVHLIGRVGQDPEIRVMQGSGKSLAKLSLATSKRWRNKDGEKQEKTTWHNLVCFQEGLVKVIETYVHKGDLIAVQGEIETRSWEKDDGEKRYVTEIIVSDLEMLGGSAKSDGDSRPQDNAPAQRREGSGPAPSFARDDLSDCVPF